MRISKLIFQLCVASLMALLTHPASAGELVAKDAGASLFYSPGEQFNTYCLNFVAKPGETLAYVSMVIGPKTLNETYVHPEEGWTRLGPKMEKAKDGKNYSRHTLYPDKGNEKELNACLVGMRDSLAMIHIQYGYNSKKERSFDVKDLVGRFGKKTGGAAAEPPSGAGKDVKNRLAGALLNGLLNGRNNSERAQNDVPLAPANDTALPPGTIVPGTENDPNPHRFAQPDAVGRIAPDVNLMQKGGQFIVATGKFRVLATMQETQKWGRHHAFCLEANAKFPVDNVYLSLPLPMSDALELFHVSGTWEVNNASVFPLGNGINEYRWSAKRISREQASSSTNTYGARFCLRGFKPQHAKALPYFEKLKVTVVGGGVVIAYVPDPTALKYRTPDENAVTNTLKTYRTDGLRLVSGVDYGDLTPAQAHASHAPPELPAAATAQAAPPLSKAPPEQKEPQTPASASGARIAGGELDIQYSRETQGGNIQHCFDIYNPTGRAIDSIEIGSGSIAIPFESGHAMSTRDRLGDWNVNSRLNASEKRQYLRFAVAGFSKGKEAARRDHIGKACFKADGWLESRLPDMSKMEHTVQFH